MLLKLAGCSLLAKSPEVPITSVHTKHWCSCLVIFTSPIFRISKKSLMKRSSYSSVGSGKWGNGPTVKQITRGNPWSSLKVRWQLQYLYRVKRERIARILRNKVCFSVFRLIYQTSNSCIFFWSDQQSLYVASLFPTKMNNNGPILWATWTCRWEFVSSESWTVKPNS